MCLHVCLRASLCAIYVLADALHLLQRTGQRRELLAGPTLYGVSHVLLTVLAWRSHPAAAAGLATLCAGEEEVVFSVADH